MGAVYRVGVLRTASSPEKTREPLHTKARNQRHDEMRWNGPVGRGTADELKKDRK